MRRFGPAHNGWPADQGKVTVKPLESHVQFQDGLPTNESYTALAKEVAAIEGESWGTVRFNYFKTSEDGTIALENWMKGWKNRQAPYYQVNSQNCAVFCIAGLIQGHAIDNSNISIIPNVLFETLMSRAAENWDWLGRWGARPLKEKVTTKICWTDEKGKEKCQ